MLAHLMSLRRVLVRLRTSARIFPSTCSVASKSSTRLRCLSSAGSGL
ncbi:MAG: hypothetical protein QF832_15525 [SAR324 cluster bacterium]|nr:hypothetical protein [SAR324 cluster bacterium]